MGAIADDSGQIRLDSVAVEARAQLFPEALREPFVWLCAYVREDCGRNMDVLISRARKLDIHLDSTTWSRIIRAKWNRDSDGNELPSPIVAEAKLLRYIHTLRKDSQNREQGGKIPFVVTSVAKSIFDYIDKKRAPDRVCKFGIVVGHTGCQKTATFRQYCVENNHGACNWFDAPETPSMGRLKTDMTVRFGQAAELSNPRKDAAIRRSINDRKTIILENVQRLYDPRQEWNQPIFNFLQKLQEDTGCTVILSFTPVFEDTFRAGRAKGFFEQFEGRSGGQRTWLRLPDYPPEEDVLQIAQAFKLKDAPKHLEYLTKIAHEPGRIRVLFEALQDARIRSERKKVDLTVDHIKYVRDEE